MFGFIRSISFTVKAMIPILGLALYAIAWFFPGTLAATDQYGNGLFYLPADGWIYPFWSGMVRLPLWAQILPACLIAVLTASLLVNTDQKNLLMRTRSYAIAYVFLFLVASSGQLFLFHPVMVSGFFILMSYRFLLDLYKDETAYAIVFGMGFSMGIAVLIYPPAIFLVPALLIGLLLMVTTGWRHWLVSLMGLIVPALLAAGFWYLVGELEYEVFAFSSWFKIRDSFFPGFFAREPFIAIWVGLILVWAVIASWRYRNPKIQARQLFQANFLLFVSILIITVLMETVSVEILWLISIPVSYLMTFWALNVERGWLRDLFFFTLLLSFAFFRVRGVI